MYHCFYLRLSVVGSVEVCLNCAIIGPTKSLRLRAEWQPTSAALNRTKPPPTTREVTTEWLS